MITNSEYSIAISDSRLKRHVGPALHVLRVHRKLTQAYVAAVPVKGLVAQFSRATSAESSREDRVLRSRDSRHFATSSTQIVARFLNSRVA